MSHLLRLFRLLSVALVATAAVAFHAAAASAADATSYSGKACLLRVTTTSIVSTTLEPVPCAELASTGGAENSHLLALGSTTLVPDTATLNNAEVFGGHTVGQGNQSHTHSSVANIDLTIAQTHVAAEFLSADASARCVAGAPVSGGSGEVAGLTVGSQHFDVVNGPLTITEGPLTVQVNDVQTTTNGNHAETDVTVLRITVAGVGEIDVITAHADITCQGAGEGNCLVGDDFVTGGGWFTGLATSGGSSKRQFANAAGYKNKGIWGHLEYQDKPANVKVHGDPIWYGPSAGTPLFSYLGSIVSGPAELIQKVDSQLGVAVGTDPATTRYILGSLDTGGFYLVRVVDNGEPGHGSDQFTIAFLTLSNGVYDFAPSAYAATSEGQGLGGGNIQLHKPKCA